MQYQVPMYEGTYDNFLYPLPLIVDCEGVHEHETKTIRQQWKIYKGEPKVLIDAEFYEEMTTRNRLKTLVVIAAWSLW